MIIKTLQLAYAIANVMFLSQGLHAFALGLFVTGCAPGGGASNYWTILLDGNLPISVTMTFVSTLASLGKLYFADREHSNQMYIYHSSMLESESLRKC